MRIIFIFGVLLNHTTTALERMTVAGSSSQLFFNASHLMLHFTRMGFMFMTGLVLTLNYYNRQKNWPQFWKKRYLSSGIPYIFWNGFFLLMGMIADGVAFNGWSYFKIGATLFCTAIVFICTISWSLSSYTCYIHSLSVCLKRLRCTVGF